MIKNVTVYRSKDCTFPARCEGIEHFLKEIAVDLMKPVEFVLNDYDWPKVAKRGTFPPIFSFSKVRSIVFFYKSSRTPLFFSIIDFCVRRHHVSSVVFLERRSCYIVVPDGNRKVNLTCRLSKSVPVSFFSYLLFAQMGQD